MSHTRGAQAGGQGGQAGVGVDLEEQMILRVPEHIAAELRKMIRQAEDKNAKSFDTRVAFVVEATPFGGGTFAFGKKKYAASLVNLPTIVETYKTNDNSNYYKSADVGQMLVVHDVEKSKGRARIQTDEQGTITHGICPPFRGIKKRFRQLYPNKSEISEVDNDLSRIKGGGIPGSVNIEVVEEDEDGELLDGTPARQRNKRGESKAAQAARAREKEKEAEKLGGAEDANDRKKKKRRTSKQKEATEAKEAQATEAAVASGETSTAPESKGKKKKKPRTEKAEGAEAAKKERKPKRKRAKNEEEGAAEAATAAGPKEQPVKKKRRASPKKAADKPAGVAAAHPSTTTTTSSGSSAMDMALALELESTLAESADSSASQQEATPATTGPRTTVAPPPLMQLPLSISQPKPRPVTTVIAPPAPAPTPALPPTIAPLPISTIPLEAPSSQAPAPTPVAALAPALAPVAAPALTADQLALIAQLQAQEASLKAELANLNKALSRDREFLNKSVNPLIKTRFARQIASATDKITQTQQALDQVQNQLAQLTPH